MRRLTTRTAAAVALATAAMLVAGCAAGTTATPSAPPEGVLVIDQAFTAQSIDPATIFQTTDSIVATGIYETLLSYEGDVAEPKPLLAKEYTASDDGRTFTFTLDERATFANGDPVTSADVLFSLNRLKNLQSSPAYLMDGLTVTAPDESTVVITAENPAAYVPHIVSSSPTSIVSASAVAEAGGSDAEGAVETDGAGPLFTTPENGVGSGPYQLLEYDSNSQITLVKNEDYWGGDAAYDRIVLRNVNNAQQQKANVESGESQVALDIPGRIATEMEGDAIKVQSTASPEVLYLGMSVDPSSPTADPAVREAIRLGIDYEQLLTLAGAGAIRASGIIPSKMEGALPVEDAVQTDVEAATAMIADAGATGETVVLDYANDYTRLAGIDYNILAQGIQTQLNAIGLQVELNPTPTSTSLQRYIDGEVQLTLWSWPPDFVDPQNLLVFGPGDLIGSRLHWDAEAAPELAELGAAAAAAGGEGRADAYRAWNEALAEEGPYAYLLEPSFFLVANSSVGTISHDTTGSVNLAQIAP